MDAEAEKASVPGRPVSLSSTTPRELQWELGTVIGGDLNDSILQTVVTPAVNATGLFLADLSANRVLHLAHDGSIKWSYGSKGGGPDEFREPRDIRLDRKGQVWVLDPQNVRITVLDKSGDARHRIPLRELTSRPLEIVPLEDGTAVIVSPNAERPLVPVDTLGNTIGAIEMPWGEFKNLSPLATQLVTAHDPNTDTWVTAFRLGDGFFQFRGDEYKGTPGWFAERIGFPRPRVKKSGNTVSTFFAPEQPPVTARSITLSPTRLYVLFGGKSDFRKRLIDMYQRGNGEYLGSILLPEPAIDISWYEGGFYVLSENPYPQITYMKAGELLP